MDSDSPTKDYDMILDSDQLKTEVSSNKADCSLTRPLTNPTGCEEQAVIEIGNNVKKSSSNLIRKASDSRVIGIPPSPLMNPINCEEQTVIEIGKNVKKSSSNLIRKASDPRIIGTADLDLAQKLQEGKTLDDTNLEESDGDNLPNFAFNHEGFSSKEAMEKLALHGRNELPEKVVPKWLIFIQQLWQPMPIMIWIAIVIEAAIMNWIDMGILLLIQFANASIGYYEITKAGDAVAALKKSLKPEATVKRDGKFQKIDASLVVPGDCVLLASGSAVPADCRVADGEIEVDQAQLTGESLPVTMFRGDKCLMGSTVVRGEVEGTVEFTGANTFFGKTASLLGQTVEYSNLQMVLINIVCVLVVIATALCLIVFLYLHLGQGTTVQEALSFAVVLLVASIPMAIEIVTTTTLALGSKELSHHGAIVSRLAAIEDMAGMAILCSDKTGTLTLNKMMLQDYTPLYTPGETQKSLLRYAAMAAKWKEPARDALDTLVLSSVDLDSLDTIDQLAFMPFDPIIKRTEGTVRENGGKIFKTTKGAPHVLLKLCNDPDIQRVVESDVQELGARGIRCLAIAKSVEDNWQMLGLLTFLDPPRPDTKQTIASANDYGVSVKMITGDHLLIARETARVLEMGNYVVASDGLPLLDPVTKSKPDNLSRDYGDLCLAADGFAQVFPEHKYLIVECLRELGYKVGMTGDGVNDAPALKRADVGVAVAGATDAARAAADIILTEEGLGTIIHGIVVSRCIFVRIRNFITYRIAATLQLLIFFFIAVFAFPPSEYVPANYKSIKEFDAKEWPDYFHMPVLMLMLITLLNDGTLIAIGYDNAIPSRTPDKWNLSVLFTIGSVLAAIACVSSLLLLHLLLDSWNEGGLFQKWGIAGLSYGQITTSIYLKVSVSDFLTLFSARTGEDFFWASKPAPILFGAGTVALSISTILACVWPDSYPDGIYALGLARREPFALPVYIWIYCIVWFLIQDGVKVLAYKLMKENNIFEINNTGKYTMPESVKNYIAKNKASQTIVHPPGRGHH